MITSKNQPLRFAVVGLGHFAQTAILPAFANAKDQAELAALVTGDEEKAIEALRESYAKGRPVQLEPLPEDERPDAPQSIRRAPPQKPQTVKAASPSQE